MHNCSSNLYMNEILSLSMAHTGQLSKHVYSSYDVQTVNNTICLQTFSMGLHTFFICLQKALYLLFTSCRMSELSALLAFRSAEKKANVILRS